MTPRASVVFGTPQSLRSAASELGRARPPGWPPHRGIFLRHRRASNPIRRHVLSPFSRSILLSLVFSAVPACLGQVWSVQRSGTMQNLLGVSFADSLHGIVVGAQGTILLTSDGGEFWKTIPSVTSADLASVKMLDTLNAIALGDEGIILRSTDGGLSWTGSSSGTTRSLKAIAFFDRSTGIAVGDSGTILRTTDGGMSWAAQQSGTSRELNGVSCATRTTATAAGDFGIVLQTTDAGASWYPLPTGWNESLTAISFADSLNGAIALSSGSVFFTNTGGAGGWFMRNIPPRSSGLKAIALADNRRGLVVGGEAKAFLTSNGGGSWITQATNAGSSWNGVDFPDPLTATVVGDGGAIIHTISGGGTEALFPVSLSSPANGDPVRLVELPISWNAEPQASAYRIQIATDSLFAAGSMLIDSTVTGAFAFIDRLQFGTRYFWRVKALSPPGSSVWSDVWGFTTCNYQALTIRQIQEKTIESLQLADTLQNSPRSGPLQASAYRGIPVRLLARCVVPANVLSMSAPTMVVYDTGSAPGPWEGIPVVLDTTVRGGDFMNVKRDDLVLLRGVVEETPAGGANSTTVLRALSTTIMGSASGEALVLTLPVAEFRKGSYPYGKVNFSQGEEYEGMIVEFHGLTVSSVLDSSRCMLILTDGNLNSIETSDLSHWFTPPPVDSTTSSALPAVGSHLDTVRGIIVTVGSDGRCANDAGYMIAPLSPSDMVFGPPSRSAIQGSVYADINCDSVRNGGEPGIPSMPIIIDGKIRTTVITDSTGAYFLGGLDSGSYRVSEPLSPYTWLTQPATADYMVKLGFNDTAWAKSFGNFAHLNTLSGRVFEDRNENGVFDSNDVPLRGWTIKQNGGVVDQAESDSGGSYFLAHVSYGTSVISLVPVPNWEQISPQLQQPYSFDFENLDQHQTHVDFAVHRIPSRVKLELTVHDSTFVAQREIWCGVRPAATYGIWGVDANCTSADYSEGELELPPVLWGMFDARFTDPHNTGARFGNGSWTDMRAYVSPAQVDTYLIQFSPGLANGGSYPMTVRWSSRAVRTAYDGQVVIGDTAGTLFDMRSTDSVVVVNPKITSLILIAERPALPVLSVPPSPQGLPGSASLLQNFPNPFNPSTTIRYVIPRESFVTLTIYDVLGREVEKLVNERKAPGSYSIYWNPGAVPSGVYFYRLTAGSFTNTKKTLIIR